MQHFSDQELTALLDDLESARVERKQDFSGDVPKQARQAVCAFANDLPNHNQAGVLFIGAKDNGAPSGLPITERLLNALVALKTDGNILPLPALTVEKRQLKGTAMAVVTVMPSDQPPLKYQGRIWIRTGARRAIANQQEERILTEKRRHKNLPFDILPSPPAKITDLARGLFENEYLPRAFAEDILQANERSYEQRLAVCKMLAAVDDTTPTTLGLLTLGNSPQDFLPGAYIQFLRIDGTELADPVVDSADIRGTLGDMLRRVEEKLQSHNRVAVDATSTPTHQLQTQYPHVALQQILYNAVQHRSYQNTNAPVRVYWYNDRIEINSPGGPYGNVTPQNFGQPGITDYRNPNISEVLKILGYVQTFGRGIDIAAKALQKNGHPRLEFTTNHSLVIGILRRKQ